MSNRFIHSKDFREMPRKQRILELIKPEYAPQEIYLAGVSPYLPNSKYDPLELVDPVRIPLEERGLLKEILSEKEKQLAREGLAAHEKIMKLLNPELDLSTQEATRITNQCEKIENLVVPLSPILINRLWEEEKVREYVWKVRKWATGGSYPIGFHVSMEELQDMPVDMYSFIYKDVIRSVRSADAPTPFPAFSSYRFKTDRRRFEKALRLLCDRYNTHPANKSRDGTWKPALTEQQEIFDKSWPLDLFGFSVIYLGKHRFWYDKYLKGDPVQDAIDMLTNENTLEGYSFYRPPKNDYKSSRARLDRVQIVYKGPSGIPFEGIIVDLASLIRIQEYGQYAHPEKKKTEAIEHHGRPFTSDQSDAIRYVQTQFRPIVVDRRQ